MLTHITEESGRIKLLHIYCDHYVQELIERYYYVYGNNFDEENLKNIYQPIENFLYADKLHFDVSIPILFVQFDVDEFTIAPRTIVRRITDEVQKARHKIVGYSPAVVDSVFMAATHELVFTDYECDRPYKWMQIPFSHGNLQTEKFFTILKIVTDFTSGFAQFLVHPKNWVESYSSDLKPLTGAAIKSYPSHFDDYYWNNNEYPKVSLEQMQIISDLFTRATESKENKLEFALKRFYKSIMR